jgi:hypothetical protein
MAQRFFLRFISSKFSAGRKTRIGSNPTPANKTIRFTMGNGDAWKFKHFVIRPMRGNGSNPADREAKRKNE